MKQRKVMASLVGAVLIGVSSFGVGVQRADAALVTFSFSGEVTSFLDVFDRLGGSVNVGTPFSGVYTFESTTPDTETGDPSRGVFDDAVTSLSGMVGGLAFVAADTMDVRVLNNYGLTNDDFYSLSGFVNFVGQTVSFSLQLRDPTATMLLNDSLPLFPPQVSDELTIRFFGLESQAAGVSMSGVVNSLVPEPGTLTLLALGIAGAFVRCRHERFPRCARRRRLRRCSVLIIMFFASLNLPSLVRGQTICGCMDIVFLIDTSQSMQSVFPQIEVDLQNIVDNVAVPASGGQAGDLRLGLITFGNTVIVKSPLTTDTASVLNLIASLEVVNGGSRPEASDEALREMLEDSVCTSSGDFNVPFRTQCTKHAVLITDALPSGCDDSFDGCVDANNADVRGDEAVEAEIRISAIYVPTPTSTACGTPPLEACVIMMNYASKTGGVFAEVNSDGVGIQDALNGIINECPDCQPNGINDFCDINCNASGCAAPCGSSTDCNINGIPDDCEPNMDCNGNGEWDICDIAAGTSLDCDKDGTPDDCQPDCDGNTVNDICQLAGGDPQFDPLTALTNIGRVRSVTATAKAADGRPVRFDLDGDGDVDIAVVDFGFAETVQILLNDGTGGFPVVDRSTIPLQTNLFPLDVVGGDFDADNHIDLAVVGNGNPGEVILLINKGTPGAAEFNPPSTPITVCSEGNCDFPDRIVTADFDGDGDLDLATANRLHGTVAVLYNNGQGAFQETNGAPPDLAGENAFGTTTPDGFAAGDLNGDGRADIAASSTFFDKVFLLLSDAGTTDAGITLGQLPGNWIQLSSPSPTLNPFSVTIVDLDRDCIPDVVASTDTDIVVWRNQGGDPPTFAPASTFCAGGQHEFVLSADVDSDRFADIVAVSKPSVNNFAVFVNDRTGVLDFPFRFDRGPSVGANDRVMGTAADFNGDGRVDIATARGSEVDVLINTTMAPMLLDGDNDTVPDVCQLGCTALCGTDCSKIVLDACPSCPNADTLSDLILGPGAWVIDARQPHELGECPSSGDRSVFRGLGFPGSVSPAFSAEPIQVKLTSSGALVSGASNPACWASLCEQDVGVTAGCQPQPLDPYPNVVCKVDEVGTGVYDLTLARPITAGRYTTIHYAGSSQSPASGVTYGYLPADVTGDGTSSALDILRVIDCLNGVQTCELYQGDLNRSNASNAQDILTVIDLLNGAGSFDPWNGVSIGSMNCDGETTPNVPGAVASEVVCDNCTGYDTTLALWRDTIDPELETARLFVENECSIEATVVALGPRYLAITPAPRVDDVALIVTGKCGNTDVTCEAWYVMMDGTLEANPLLGPDYQAPSAWGTVIVTGQEIMPGVEYVVQTQSSVPMGSSPTAPAKAKTWMWGDTFPAPAGDGAVDLDDILCGVAAFGETYPLNCTLQSADLFPCTPDATVDLDDILSLLAAFSGDDYSMSTGCTAPCSPPLPPENAPSGPAVVISLIANLSTVPPGGLVTVEAFIDAASDLRGYQLALEATGGTTGTLTLESLSIDTLHVDANNIADFVFDNAPTQIITATDEIGGRLTAGLYSGGMSVGPDKYLGTFAFRASADASGAFSIDLRSADTFLRDSNSQPVPWQSAGALQTSSKCKVICALE